MVGWVSLIFDQRKKTSFFGKMARLGQGLGKSLLILRICVLGSASHLFLYWVVQGGGSCRLKKRASQKKKLVQSMKKLMLMTFEKT